GLFRHPALDVLLADELEQRDQPVPAQRGRSPDLLAHPRTPFALAVAGRRALRRLLRAHARDRRHPARPPRHLTAETWHSPRVIRLTRGPPLVITEEAPPDRSGRSS